MKYSEIYKGKKSIDKKAYMSQVEVSNSTPQIVQNLAEKVDLLANQLTSLEERIVNLTRLIKLLQANDELYEQELERISNIVKDTKGLDKSQLKEGHRNV